MGSRQACRWGQPAPQLPVKLPVCTSGSQPRSRTQAELKCCSSHILVFQKTAMITGPAAVVSMCPPKFLCRESHPQPSSAEGCGLAPGKVIMTVSLGVHSKGGLRRDSTISSRSVLTLLVFLWDDTTHRPWPVVEPSIWHFSVLGSTASSGSGIRWWQRKTKIPGLLRAHLSPFCFCFY